MPTPVYEDNNSCIAWSEGAVGGTDRAKHIDLRRYFVHDAVKAQLLVLLPIASAHNVADIFTKPPSLPKDPLHFFRKTLLGL